MASAALSAWLLKEEAVAMVFIDDINGIQQAPEGSGVYYINGRVPCEVVELVGLIVGIDVSEKRTLYYLDDGSSILAELNISHKYKLVDAPAAQKITTFHRKQQATKVWIVSQKLARVGQTVKVRVRLKSPWGNSGQLELVVVNEKMDIVSVTDQLNHASQVLELHRTVYSSIEPFTVPSPLVPLPTFDPPSTPRASTSSLGTQPTIFRQQISSSSKFSAAIPSSDYEQVEDSFSRTVKASSKVKQFDLSMVSSIGNSIVSSTLMEARDKKLRNPSTVPSTKCTPALFRLYLLDFLERESRRWVTELELRSIIPELRNWDGSGSSNFFGDTTAFDHDSISGTTNFDYDNFKTPNSSQLSALSHHTSPEKQSPEDMKPPFSIPQLVAIPTLLLLARKVEKVQRPTSAAVPTSKQKREAVEKLFRVAVRGLYDCGAIVIVERPAVAGKKRKRSGRSQLSKGRRADSTLLESSSSAENLISSSSPGGRSASMPSVTKSRNHKKYCSEDEDGLSSTDDILPLFEESYLPLTPTILGPFLLMLLQPSSIPTFSRSSSANRLVRALDTETVLARLKAADERWRRVSRLTVDSVLEAMRIEGLVSKDDVGWRKVVTKLSRPF